MQLGKSQNCASEGWGMGCYKRISLLFLLLVSVSCQQKGHFRCRCVSALIGTDLSVKFPVFIFRTMHSLIAVVTASLIVSSYAWAPSHAPLKRMSPLTSSTGFGAKVGCLYVSFLTGCEITESLAGQIRTSERRGIWPQGNENAK